MRPRARTLLIAAGACAGIAILAWLAHGPALPRAWAAIRPGMAAAEAERILGPAGVAAADGIRIDAELPGDPLVHGRRRWLVLDLAGGPDGPRVAGMHLEDGYRADWLYRVPGLARLL